MSWRLGNWVPAYHISHTGAASALAPVCFLHVWWADRVAGLGVWDQSSAA